jgi:hypothetical protein
MRTQSTVSGFAGSQRLDVLGGSVQGTVEGTVASVYLQSGSAPHLFGTASTPSTHNCRSCSPGRAQTAGSADRCQRSP